MNRAAAGTDKLTAMPQHWPWTVGIAVGTAILTTLILEMLIKPRIERRNRRQQLARASRDVLSDNMLVILSAASRLTGDGLPRGTASALRARMQAEQQRWYGQIDDATQYLIDNLHTYLLTYIGLGGFRDLLVRYVMDARGIVLSERSRVKKAEQLTQMTELAWNLFFGVSILRPSTLLRLVRSRTALESLLDLVEHEGDQQASASTAPIQLPPSNG